MRSLPVYAIPAGLAALAASALLSGAATSAAADSLPLASGSVHTSALLLLVSPALVIGLLLAKRHLIEALLLGIANAVAIALRLGVITPFDLLHLDRATFGATNILVEGMQRAVGVIIFKLLLVSLVGTLQATDALDRLDARRAKAGIVDAQCEEPDRNCCLNCRVAHYAQRVRKF